MKQEAESHSAEDELRKNSIEAKNRAESVIYSIETNLSTYKDELNEQEKDDIKSKVADTRNSLATNDAKIIENAVKELEDFSGKLFAAAYQRKSAKGGNQGGESPPPPPNEEEKVDDAEFKDVKK